MSPNRQCAVLVRQVVFVSAAACWLMVLAASDARAIDPTDDTRENIIIIRNVPAHVPYRDRPSGAIVSMVDPSPDEQLLSSLGVTKTNGMSELSDDSIAAVTSNWKSLPLVSKSLSSLETSPSPAGGAGTGNQSSNLRSVLELGAALSGPRGPGAQAAAAGASLVPRINNALLPLSGVRQ